MKIIRFVSNQQVYTGEYISDDEAQLLDQPQPGHFHPTGKKLKIDKLLSPIVPTDLLCVGLNYHGHAREMNMTIPQHPLLFIKSSNALNNPGDPIFIPHNSDKIDYEGELVIVIGRDAKDVPIDRAADHILGYTIANDVSARDWQKDPKLNGGQFTKGKSFDGFCPLGPWIITTDELKDPNHLRIRTFLNGRLMQDSNTSDMIFNCASVVSLLSATMTLRAGCVILTGTPAGVGVGRKPPVFMKAGDQVAIEIEGLGRLENPVKPIAGK